MIDILTKLVSVIESGTETEVRQFVRDHWTELPPRLQDHLGASILIDSINEQERAIAGFEAFRKDVLDIAQGLSDESFEVA